MQYQNFKSWHPFHYESSNSTGPLAHPCGSPCSQLLVLAGRSSNLDHGAGGSGLCVCRLFMKRRSAACKKSGFACRQHCVCVRSLLRLPNRTRQALVEDSSRCHRPLLRVLFFGGNHPTVGYAQPPRRWNHAIN